MPRCTGIACRFIRPTWRFWSVAATSASIRCMPALSSMTGMALCAQAPVLMAKPINAPTRILFIESSLQILITAVDLPPLTERQTIQCCSADGCPYQTQRRITDGRRHAPDLAVLAFRNADFQPRRRDRRTKADRRITLP